jgi:hypothetical protein
MNLGAESLTEALTTLGELLESRQLHFEVVAIGGGALLLLGVLDRPTKDLDIVALREGDQLSTAEPLPPGLVQACADVARAMGLATNWMNAGPTSLLEYGLPDGFVARADQRTYGTGLIVHIASRIDQIHFKFYATVDDGPLGKHVQDLRKLAPTHDELRAAARWAVTHDTSEPFRDLCRQVLAAFGAEPDFDR